MHCGLSTPRLHALAGPEHGADGLVTAATQLKIDGGVQHLNVSGVDIQHYWPHCLHIGLRSVSKTWKQTYKVVAALSW